MLLKIAVNAAICSTFEVQYGKSTSTRTFTHGIITVVVVVPSVWVSVQ